MKEKFHHVQKESVSDSIHDLNNLIFTIITYANFLKEDLDDGSKEKNYTNSVLRAGLQAQDIVSCLLGNSEKFRASAQVQISSQNTKNKKILVVEDQEDVRQIVSAMLSGMGHSVISVSDPVTAFEKMDQCKGRVDLILTDQSMPGMKGADFSDCVSLKYPNIPVVLMSGYPPQVLSDVLLKHPTIRSTLQKPIQPDDLARMMSDVFDGISVLSGGARLRCGPQTTMPRQPRPEG